MATEGGRAADKTRLVCIEQVHGAAGCNDWGIVLKIFGVLTLRVVILI